MRTATYTPPVAHRLGSRLPMQLNRTHIIRWACHSNLCKCRRAIIPTSANPICMPSKRGRGNVLRQWSSNKVVSRRRFKGSRVISIPANLSGCSRVPRIILPRPTVLRAAVTTQHQVGPGEEVVPSRRHGAIATLSEIWKSGLWKKVSWGIMGRLGGIKGVTSVGLNGRWLAARALRPQ